MAKGEVKGKVLRITLVRSPIGYAERQKKTVRALGLRRMNQTVEHADTAQIRGMIAKIPHLLRVEEQAG
ncbi:MAG: 50S ribosomal protein L30 [Chloroflexi bacterium]|jgi:large subunit ribosomal protein L30|nr:50S ribosomal protein L30 [Chloroflexota bacterium]